MTLVCCHAFKRMVHTFRWWLKDLWTRAKSEAETDINYVHKCCNSKRSWLWSMNTVFGVAILRNESSQFASVRGGWAGYGTGSFFSHGFQPAFTFETVFKALDCDLIIFCTCYMSIIWGNTPSFVSTWLCPTSSEPNRSSYYYYNYNDCAIQYLTYHKELGPLTLYGLLWILVLRRSDWLIGSTVYKLQHTLSLNKQSPADQHTPKHRNTRIWSHLHVHCV